MILVTGGTGLVGAHLLYHLAKDEVKIRAIYRREEKIEAVRKIFFSYSKDALSLMSKIEWLKADITDVPSMIPAFVSVEKVYHCAAFISFNSKDYIAMRKINIHGTAIIVNLSIEAKIKKLCFVSSIACIGDAINGKLINEENEWNKEADNSGYAITKFGAEIEVWRASQEGIAVVIINPGIILGSGFLNTGSGKIFNTVNNGLRYYTEGITGFVGVKDVVRAMILLMNSKVEGEQFLLVSENKSFKEVLFAIAAALQKKRPSIKVKPWQTSLFWRVSKIVSKVTGKQPFMTKFAARSAHGVSQYSSEKIIKTLDFKFTKIEEVIIDVCKRITS